MELITYWKLVRNHIWLILLLPLCGGSAAFYYSQIQVPKYRSTTTLYLNPAVSTSVVPSTQPSLSIQALANTYAEYMRTTSFANLVMQKAEVTLTEEEFADTLSTTFIKDTQFFRISATHTDPQVAQRLAKISAEVLIAENIVRQQAQQQQINEQRDPANVEEQQQITEIKAALQDELASYTKQITTLQTTIADLEAADQSTATEARIQNLRNDLRNLQSMRVNVLTSLSQTQAALASATTDSRSADTAVVIDVAPLPAKALSRGTLRYTFLGILASLLLAAGLVWLLEQLDYTIRDAEMLNQVYGLPSQTIIGAVAGSAGRNIANPSLVTISAPFSPASEAFRSLRTSIQVASLNGPIRNLLITSARPGEGKSFVAANLAVSLAKNGSQVILVDADLRRPTLHSLFGLGREPGFTDVVLDPHKPVESVLRRTEVDGLRLLTCGMETPNPAELLGAERASLVMAELMNHADIVVYDTPPAATVTDPIVLAPRMDAVFQVVGAGTTRIPTVLQCKTLLESVQVRMLGPVLNRVQTSNMGYESSYYYGYAPTSQERNKLFSRLFGRRAQGLGRTTVERATDSK